MKITCCSCGNGFEAMAGFEDYEQAAGCSSVVSGNRLEGFYGSAVIDAQLLHIDEPRPDWVRDGLMCDGCVKRLQNANAVIPIEIGRWFGTDHGTWFPLD